MEKEKISFTIMWKDKECTKVSILGAQVKIKIIDQNPLHNLVANMPVDLMHLMQRLETRCFPRNRVNAKEILSKMGLENYDILGIIKFTHGVKTDDFVWIKFDGEDLTFKDVRIR